MITLLGDIGGEINIGSFAENETDFVLNSRGGDLYEGLAIYDLLSSRENVTVHAVGMVASAATLALLATEKRFATENTRFVIHNPFTFGVGDANGMQKVANELSKDQSALIDIYAKHLSIERAEIETLMNQDTVINAQKALEIGLIREIKPLNSNSNMDKSEIKNELSGIKAMFGKIMDLFSAPKNILLQDVNGTELEFPDAETPEQVIVGSVVNVGGAPANGEFVMPDGRTIKAENGTVTEISVAQSEDATAELKTEIENLKAENERLKADAEIVNSVKNELEKIKTEFANFQNKFSSEKADEKMPAQSEPETKEKTFSFKSNRK